MKRFVFILSAMCVAGAAFGDGSTPRHQRDVGERPQKGHLDEVQADVAAPGAAPQLYQEYLSYGAYARTSYVPGFIPKTSSLFENPREYPANRGKLSDPYLTSGIAGWFYASPNGYQSSVPPNSQAHDYVTGKLGITSSLQYGLPRGMKVVEPVIIPFAAYSEPGGFYISTDTPTGPAVQSQILRPAQTTVQRSETTTREVLPQADTPATIQAPRPAGALEDSTSDK